MAENTCTEYGGGRRLDVDDKKIPLTTVSNYIWISSLRKNFGPKVFCRGDFHMARLSVVDNSKILCVASTLMGVAVFNRACTE